VIGKFNVDGDYAFIIGAGSDDSHRKNIFTLGWDGTLKVDYLSSATLTGTLFTKGTDI